jgi:hypothetical protein
VRGQRMIGAVIRRADFQRLAVELLGLRVTAEVELDGAEIDQIFGDQRMAVAIQFAMHVESAPK